MFEPKFEVFVQIRDHDRGINVFRRVQTSATVDKEKDWPVAELAIENAVRDLKHEYLKKLADDEEAQS